MRIIKFRSAIGFEGIFNTIRLSQGRMKEGEIVALFDLQVGKTVETATVKSIAIGVPEAMLVEHAKNNHSVIHFRPDDPIQFLTKRLQAHYGKKRMSETQQIAVIYLCLNGKS